MVNLLKKETVYDYALEYIGRGWNVFPIVYKLKIPFKNSRGFNDATTEATKIKEWFDCQDLKNIAIRTGTISNLVVVDVDRNNEKQKDGFESIEALGEMPDTYTVRTKQGYHYYFTYPSNGFVMGSTKNLGAYGGIDIRGNDSYVVAPPSMHPSGIVYEVIKDLPLVELPEIIIELYNDRTAANKRSKKKNNAKTQESAQKRNKFVMLFEETYLGMAHQKLSGPQAFIYVYMLGKCGKKDNGKYSPDTNFECPYSFIKEDLGYSDNTICRAIKVLIEKGFIELIRQGGSRNETKWTSLYRLSNKWEKIPLTNC